MGRKPLDVRRARLELASFQSLHRVYDGLAHRCDIPNSPPLFAT
ncbi:MAG: hypothetical protein QW587_02325 [Candidatus Bathyarchaeia archaeon]